MRYVNDVFPLDATLIKRSHSRVDVAEGYQPVIITNQQIDHPLITTDILCYSAAPNSLTAIFPKSRRLASPVKRIFNA